MPKYRLSTGEREPEAENKENLHNIIKGTNVKNFDDLKGVFKMMVLRPAIRLNIFSLTQMEETVARALNVKWQEFDIPGEIKW